MALAAIVLDQGHKRAVAYGYLCAVHRADLLDPALLRAGRFDRKVQLLRPDTAGRFEILKVTSRAVSS